MKFTCFSPLYQQSSWFEVPSLFCAAAAPSLLSYGELRPLLLLLLLLLCRNGSLSPSLSEKGKHLASHPAQDLGPQALGPFGTSAAGWGFQNEVFL